MSCASATRWGRIIGSVVWFAMMLGGGASAQEPKTLQDFGKGLYLQYCGSCHGPEGKGDGVVGTFLTPKPMNLTLIAKNNGGQFPANKVMQTINGTNLVRAHGDAAMPVWGESLRYDPTQLFSKKAEVDGKIQLITSYLQSIQQK